MITRDTFESCFYGQELLTEDPVRDEAMKTSVGNNYTVVLVILFSIILIG